MLTPKSYTIHKRVARGFAGGKRTSNMLIAIDTKNRVTSRRNLRGAGPHFGSLPAVFLSDAVVSSEVCIPLIAAPEFDAICSRTRLFTKRRSLRLSWLLPTYRT